MSLFGSLWGNKGVNTCVSASGGEEIGTFYSGSQVWRYHKFTTPGNHTFTIHTGSAQDARVFLVGGGGGGGRRTGATTGAGGGGGGGAGGVLLTQYRLHSRQYDIYVGEGGTYSQDGEDTKMYPLYNTNDEEGEYFPTASYLAAEGGGRGAFIKSVTPFIEAGHSGGSGGGAARGLEGSTYYGALEGGGRVGQGSDGGEVYIPQGGSTTFEAGAGGGGSSQTGRDASFVTSIATAARGGHGTIYNVDGTNRYYGAGGGGKGEVGWPTEEANGSNSYGAGGSGSTDAADGNPGTGPDGHDYREGRSGIAVVMYPICEQELSDNCTQYLIDAGASGGSVSYVSCKTGSLISHDIVPATEGLICSYDTTADNYPQTTGDVTLTETGSCTNWFPFVTGSICTGDEVETPIYQTEIVCNTPPVGPYRGFITVGWTKYNGQTTQQEFTTGTHYICAIPGSVGIINYTVGSTWSFNQTAILCAYYCTAAPTPGSLVAEGGDVSGSYVRGNTVYKFHTFKNSGTLTLLSGSTSDMDILVVGGGGAGGIDNVLGQNGGAGGAGGFLTSSNNPVSASDGNFTITVGAGGNNSSIYGNFLTASLVGYKGGQGGDSNNNGSNGGSGGGGASYYYVGSPTYGGSAIYTGSAYNNQGNDGADGSYRSFGGGGGGAGAPAVGRTGGNGLPNDYQGFNTYFAGGGSANSTNTQGGGGAANENGVPFTGGGGGAGTSSTRYSGGSGIVVVRWTLNDSVNNNTINSLPVSRSLFSLIDMAYTESYPGSGSSLFDVSNNINSASIGNIGAYSYNTAVLDSGSLILLTSSLDNTDFDWDLPNSEYRPIDGIKSFTLLTSWFGNFLEFNTSSGYFPIFSDNTNNWGIYGGNFATWDDGVVLNAGGQLIGVGNDTAKESGGGIGWHISQMSYDSGSSTVYWNCDGVSGSAVVSGSSFGSTFNPKWNDKFASGKMGDNTACQVFAIYTSSLSFAEMEQNRAFLYPRY